MKFGSLYSAVGVTGVLFFGLSAYSQDGSARPLINEAQACVRVLDSIANPKEAGVVKRGALEFRSKVTLGRETGGRFFASGKLEEEPDSRGFVCFNGEQGKVKNSNPSDSVAFVWPELKVDGRVATLLPNSNPPEIKNGIAKIYLTFMIDPVATSAPAEKSASAAKHHHHHRRSGASPESAENSDKSLAGTGTEAGETSGSSAGAPR